MNKLTQVDPTTVKLRDNFSRYGTVDERAQQIVDRAVSMIANGQTSPVRLNQTKDGLVPITGTTRVAAGMLIQQGFKVGDVEYPPQPDFMISAEIVEVSEVEAAVMGATDNLHRDDLTWIDIGYLGQQLKKRFDWSFTQITDKLGISDPNKVAQAVKLMSYGKPIRDAIHTGKISASAGLEVFKYKDDQGKAARVALESAVKKGESITAAQIKKAAEGKEPSGGNPKPNARKGSEIREMTEGWKAHIKKLTPESSEQLPKEYLSFVNSLHDYVCGKIKDTTFSERVDKAFGVNSKIWDDVVGSDE